MGNLLCHNETHNQCPQFVNALICLQEESYKTINVGGIKDGVTVTHMTRHTMPFIDKGEQCFITFGLTEDLPIDALFKIGISTRDKDDNLLCDQESGIGFPTKAVRCHFHRATTDS
jgi:hypothetical protein